MTDEPGLEARVAALEARLPPEPLLKPYDLPPLTGEQEAQLKRDFDETMRRPLTHRVIPWPAPLVVLDETTACLELPFKALVLPGDELTIAEPAP